MKAESAALVLVFTGIAACGPSPTGGELVRFHAYASGISGSDGPVEIDTAVGFHVHLTTAKMHIGAVYMGLGQANPGAATSSCVGATTYGLQVPGPVDVDVLSSRPQEFSVLGSGTTDSVRSAEIWLFEGDIDAVASTAVVASVAGVATKNGASFPFRGDITISQNRAIPPSDPAQPGANPICKQRIVSPIPLSLSPTLGGVLWLRIDPRSWLTSVDFDTLLPGNDGVTRVIPDTATGGGPDIAAGRAFFTSVTGASSDVYDFDWLIP